MQQDRLNMLSDMHMLVVCNFSGSTDLSPIGGPETPVSPVSEHVLSHGKAGRQEGASEKANAFARTFT